MVPEVPVDDAQCVMYGCVMHARLGAINACLFVVLAGSPAMAQSTDVRSVHEPGSLGVANVGARVGFAVLDAPIGLGGEVFVGLGHVDVAVGGSWIAGPFDSHEQFISLAAQGLIAARGSHRLGARVAALHQGDDGSPLLSGELRFTTGTATRRWVASAHTISEPGENGNLVLGASAGAEMLGDRAGFLIALGIGLPVDGSTPFPTLSFGLLLH